MKKTYHKHNTTISVELYKPTKWYQWLVIIILFLGILYFLIK